MKIQTINLNRNDLRRLSRWIDRRQSRPDADNYYWMGLERGGILNVEYPSDDMMEPGPHAIARNTMVAIGKTFDYEVISCR